MADTYTPTSLAEALELLASQELTVYAGGTDLMISEAKDRPFLFTHRLEELRRFEQSAGSYYLGAGLTYSELLADERTPGLLRSAVASIAAPALRNVATIGGNVANASPKGDAALALMAADAVVHLASATGERHVPLREFYRGRGQTVLRPDELLCGFSFPERWLDDSYRFEKVGGRAALAISRVSFAGILALEEGYVAHLAVAFGAVEDTIVCHPELDARLIGKSLSEASRMSADYINDYAQVLKPIRGRVSAEYRTQVCCNILQDFLSFEEKVR